MRISPGVGGNTKNPFANQRSQNTEPMVDGLSAEIIGREGIVPPLTLACPSERIRNMGSEFGDAKGGV